MPIKLLLFVAAGGAMGAVARFAVMSGVGHWLGHGFPWGTLVVNVVGSVALGVVVELSALVWSPSPEVRALVVVGLLGAFTTFSTFSMDVYFLIDRGAVGAALGYVLASVAVCVVGFWGGIAVMRQLLA